jgi:hypothetical protein
MVKGGQVSPHHHDRVTAGLPRPAGQRQPAGDLGPGQVGRQVPQHPQLTRAELLRRRRRGLLYGRRGGPVQDVEDVGEQRGVRGLVPGSASSSPAEPVIANGRISRSASARASARSVAWFAPR